LNLRRSKVLVFDPVVKTPGAESGSHIQTGQTVLEIASNSFV